MAMNSVPFGYPLIHSGVAPCTPSIVTSRYHTPSRFNTTPFPLSPENGKIGRAHV